MRRPFASPLFASFLVAALAACGSSGGPTTPTYVCTPPCPAGWTCGANGCTNPGGAGADLAMVLPDLGALCGGTLCAAPTPFCVKGVCASCATDTDCPAGQICKSLGPTFACVPGCTDDSRCAGLKNDGGAGASCCAGQCVDTSSDWQNCGTCGMACVTANGVASCAGGACAAGACRAGWGDCNKNPLDGCETNLHSDPANCKACGTACSYANGIGGCSDGCYLSGCDFGFDDCNADPSDGCETSTLADKKNCGGCGNACSNKPHATVTCQNATCALTQCDQGWSDCNGKPDDGCETNTGVDINNCGRCGNVCGNNQVCKNSSCTCQACDIPNAKTKCVNLACTFDGCLPGWGDCNFDLKDGCETDLTSDAKNCGQCGNACPNGSPVCLASACSKIDLSGVFNQYMSEGRNVYLWKTAQCVDVTKYTTFCTDRGLSWWSPKSNLDAQTLVTNAYNIDKFHTWVQVYGLKTDMNASTLNGFNVTVDGPGCVQSCDGTGFCAFRKWACSYCDPKANGNQSCCWDGVSHAYDWFVCED